MPKLHIRLLNFNIQGEIPYLKFGTKFALIQKIVYSVKKTAEHFMINAESNGDQNIEQLIQQAEAMQLKLKLEVQFKKNMSFLEKKSPAIHERFIGYSPKNQKIFIDEDGNINLINLMSRKPAFNEDPKEFAKKQVHQFLQSPTRFVTGFKPTVLVNSKHIHAAITNKALEEYQSLELEPYYDPKSPIGLLVMVGCGLGYHIKEIVENYDIRNLFIYDSNKDSFYASLFTIDWEETVKIFNDRGGVVKLDIGGGLLHALTHMRSLPYEIGMFNLVATHVYVHTSSIDNDIFIENYRKEFHLYGTALGFFDDEQVSFAHTIHNINNNKALFLKNPDRNIENLPPVFIVGNGPSLDSLVDFLRGNQDKAIVISCGSALTSLYKLGITPDFHVELERNLTVAEMLKFGTSKEYTKNIPLLGLNNICPETASLFKESYLAIKPSDIGASILQKLLGNNGYFELECCNPTVTNCGFSYAISLGFKEIYLMGTDLGMKDEKSHHSKFSIWQDMDESKETDAENHKETLEDYTYSESRYETKGNFCDTVMTTNVLDSSRKNVELLIANNPSITVYNPNDGAYIDGAISTPVNKLSVSSHPSEAIDKDAIVKKIIDENFKKLNFKKITKKDVEEKYTALYFKILEGLELPEKCSGMADLYEHMYRIFKNMKILEATDKTTSMLAIGSIQIHFSLLYYFCLRASTDIEFEQCYNIGKKYYDMFITQATEILKEEPLRLDDTMLLK